MPDSFDCGCASRCSRAWGLGLSVVFLQPCRRREKCPGGAPRAITVVSTIGYGGFLLRAPLIGFLLTVCHSIELFWPWRSSSCQLPFWLLWLANAAANQACAQHREITSRETQIYRLQSDDLSKHNLA